MPPLELLNVIFFLLSFILLIPACSVIFALIFLVLAALHASLSLHAPLIHSVMRSPMEFFDTTPIGRILNRCAKDVEVVDSQLPMSFRITIMCFLQVSHENYLFKNECLDDFQSDRYNNSHTSFRRRNRASLWGLLSISGKIPSSYCNSIQ